MPAQIDIAGWRIEGYEHGWTMGRLKVRQSGGNVGETYLTGQTYYPSLAVVLKRLRDTLLRESDAQSLEELRERLDRVDAELMRLLEGPTLTTEGGRRR